MHEPLSPVTLPPIMENHLSTPSLARQVPPRSRYLLPILLLLATLAMPFLSAGFLEPDEIMHFVYARAAWHDPRYLLNIWARPGVTGLYAPTAPLGVVASRILAVAITALT